MARKLKIVDRGDLVLNGVLLPPAADVCQQCAVAHEREIPHNQQSLFWKYWFYRSSGGRWPTWRDAMAHCAPEVQEAWVRELTARGVAIDGLVEPGTEE